MVLWEDGRGEVRYILHQGALGWPVLTEAHPGGLGGDQGTTDRVIMGGMNVPNAGLPHSFTPIVSEICLPG